MKIIEQNGYRMTWDDGGSYRVYSVDGAEMELVTFDANPAIACIDNWAKEKAASDGNRKRHIGNQIQGDYITN